MSSIKLMINKVLDIDSKRLNYLVDMISKQNGVSKLRIKLDMILNFFRYGISYTDYMKGNYFNLTKKEKKDYIKTKFFYNLIYYLNDKEYQNIFLDKFEFNKKFKKYLNRDYIDLRKVSYDDFVNFLKGKKSVFAKKHNSFGGDGVEKIIITKDLDRKVLYDRLMLKHQYLIEDTIIQHEYLNQINPSAVNVIRIITLLNNDEVHIIGKTIRLNNGEEDVISCHDIFGTLDDDGKLLGNIVDDDCNIYEYHPLTKFEFKNMQIPYMNEAIKILKKAAKQVPEIRYIGWDVAITQEGPVLVEGNFYPSYGLIQYYLLNDGYPVGKLKLIKDILGDEIDKV